MKTAAEQTRQIGKAELHALSYAQLDLVAGGVPITKVVDQASPNLFASCCNGKHFTSGQIH